MPEMLLKFAAEVKEKKAGSNRHMSDRHGVSYEFYNENPIFIMEQDLHPDNQMFIDRITVKV